MSAPRFLVSAWSLFTIGFGKRRLGQLGFASLIAFSSLVLLFWLMGAGQSLAQPDATTYYVIENGLGDCSSVNPCDLQTAVSQATDGDEIHVAAGTYTNSGSAVITLTVSISLTGGYDAGNWTTSPDPLVYPTILDGETARRVINITGDVNPLIQNFIIENGRAPQGAGIYNESGTPTIRRNIIRNNSTNSNPNNGGGIYDSGAAIIEENEIFQNSVTGFGGGVCVQNDGLNETILSLNEIHDNTAATGGGISVRAGAAFFEANAIYNNTADWGGGLHTLLGPTVTLFSNLFHHNEAQTGGGGAIELAADSVLWNNTIADNTASVNGGGIYVSGGTVAISNTIVASNTGGIDGIFNNGGTITGGFNNVHDDALSAGINFTDPIGGDPTFVDRVTSPYNYHLYDNGSNPNIDTGDPDTPAEVDVDIDGQTRPINEIWDVGADEYGDLIEMTIEPVTSVEYVDRGLTATLNHVVRNTGNLRDSYDFACAHSLGWAVTCPLSVTLTPQDFTAVETLLTVPLTATALEQGQMTIRVISNLSDTISTTAVVQTIVNAEPGIAFTPNYSDTVLPGDVITFTHFLTNTGDAFDDITVQLLSGSSWAELLPANTSLDIGQSALVRVRVTVPPEAPAGLLDIARIQAVSEHDVTVTGMVTDTVVAKPTSGTRYVTTNGTDDNNNCTQIGKPCDTVNHAVRQASSGDQVQVATGTYNESNIPLNGTIYISGGWINGFKEQVGPDETIIDAAGRDTLIFDIAAGSAVKPSISNMTLRNGNNGGPGGAVYVNSNAQPVFEKIIFENNTGTRGGAIYANSNALVTIRQSAFYTNTASVDGGAVYVTGGLAQIQNQIQNNLFKANSAIDNGGAVYLAGGLVTLGNNTFVENQANGDGGGVYNNGAAATVVSSIFANNGAAGGEAIYHQAGSISLNYSDLWQNGTANVPVGTGNIFVDPLFIDDQYRLGRGSPALDVADPATTLAVDFEDDFRPADAGYDMGYDELAGCRAQREGIAVPFGSIQEAIAAEASSRLVRVTGICRGVSPVDIGGQIISQTVYLTQTFTIQGGWNTNFTERPGLPTYVDPEGRGRGFYISGSITPIIEDLYIINGNATGLGGGPADEDAGGGIYNLESSTIFTDVRILTSTAVLGGGFYNHSGAASFSSTPILDIEDVNKRVESPYSHVAGNTAVSGGGIYNHMGALQVEGTRIYGNTADNGGGLYNSQGAIGVINTLIYNNEASSGNGGGVYNNANADYRHLTFYGNAAALNGGGFYNAAGDIALRDSIFQSNQADDVDGPAIYIASASGTADIDFNYYHAHANTPVAGNAIMGANDINDNLTPPGLTDPAAGNFHLLDEAAAMDMGDPDSLILTDMDGEPRPSNQAPDMGADELVGCLVRLNGVIYGSIQAALAVAQPGDTLDVAGTCSGVHPYTAPAPSACTDGSGDMLTTVHLDKNVNLVGGWRIDFSGQGLTTTLDAEQMGRVIYVAPGVTATVEGFDIINGLVSGAEGNGAGICIDQAEPTIRGNRIYSNTATNGGAIYSLNGGAFIEGGNRIFSNEAEDGAAVYADGAALTVQNNFIYSNTAATNGGAFYNLAGNNNFWHNTVYANEATGGDGGAIYVAADSPSIRSNIVMANTSGGVDGAYGATGSTPSLGYNDFYDQSPGDDFDGTVIIDGGAGHVSFDPQFRDLPALDFTLLYTTSPVVDLGDPTLSLAVDFEDDIRPSHQGFDIGADEVGGCYARILSAPNTIYGSVQTAVDAASAGDTVQVDGICYGVNERSDGDPIFQNLFVDKDLTIDGQWNYRDAISATLDALGQGRVLYVTGNAVVTVTEVIMQHGDATVAGLDGNGGAVWNGGTLVLLDSEVLASAAGSGGGIYNSGGSLTAMGNKIAGNMATSGGGVYRAGGDLILDGNWLFGNMATNGGGGVYLAGGASGIADVWNNFIYSNSGSAIYNLDTNGRVWHNTVVLNTGDGLYSTSPTNDIRSNIFDRNSGTGINTTVGSPTINYNNVYGNNPNYDGTAVASAGADEISQLPTYVNAPARNYHLVEASPGVDVADPALPGLGIDHDVDGHLRPTNGGPDMGADEINTCLIRVNDRIFGVFQDAIDYAEGLEPLPKVEVARGACRGVQFVNNTYQVGYISQSLEIVGSLRRSNFTDPNDYDNPEVGAVSSVIDAQGAGRVIVVANNAEPTFTHLALVGGNAYASGDGTNSGGGIYNADSGRFTTSETQTCNNFAENGGGYYGAAGTTADFSGAGTGDCSAAQFNDQDELIGYEYYAGNIAVVNGAGFYVANGATVDITNHGMNDNLAANNGGVIYNAGQMEVINGLYWFNGAGLDGGAIYNAGTGSLQLYHNTMRNNDAGNEGGGVYNGGSLTINSTIVYSNTAVTGGGGVHSVNAGTSSHNNFYVNEPEDVINFALDLNTRIGDPGLGFLYLDRHSRNIDAADTDLLDSRVPPIDFDANMLPRPDGGTVHTGIMASDVGAFEYWKDFGCEVVPNSQESTAFPGDTVTYLVNVVNVGNPSFLHDPFHSNGFTDTITITVASQVQGWGVLQGGDSQQVTLDYRDSASRVLTVTVPSDAQLGEQEIVSIRCESGAIPGRQFTGQVQTNVGPVNSIVVWPEYFTSAHPGDVITFTHWITNESNSAGTFRLIPSAGAAGLSTASVIRIEEVNGNVITSTTGSIDQAVALDIHQVVTAVLQVDILETAAIGEVANPGLIAQSVEDSKVQGQVINQILISPTMGTRYVALGGADLGNNCLVADQPCATIQRAVDQALAGDTIRVASGRYTDTVTHIVDLDLLEQNLFINKLVEIQGGYSILDGFTARGPITNAVTIDAEGARRGIYVAPGVTVTLSGLFIENGYPSLSGSTANYGGGIYNAGAALTVNGVWLRSNQGSGLYHHTGVLTVTNSVFANNQSLVSEGGGLYVADGTALLENNTFVENEAVPDAPGNGRGGGIYLANGTATVLNQIFQDNLADGGGEAIFVITATAVLTHDYNLYFNQLDPIGSEVGSVLPGANSIVGDPAFEDAYYHIGASSWAKDAGYSGVSIAAGVDFELEDRVQGAEIDMGADERLQRPAFVFEPITQTVTIDPGAVHTFTHHITNTGDSIDSYALAMNNQVTPAGDTGWDYALSPENIINLAQGDTVTVTLVITGGHPGYFDTTIITATSASGPVHSVVDTTHISQTAGVDIDPSRSGSGLPGTQVVYTHTLTNTGDGPDIFSLIPITLTAVPPNWIVTVMPTQTDYVRPGETTPFTTTVSIPADAWSGAQHWVEIEAIAASNTAVTDTLAVTTTVDAVYGLALVPDNEATVPDDTNVVYTHTLSNLGNITDTITLTTTSSPDWNLDFMPQTVNLPPFATTTVWVTVTVPAGTGGLTHLATITATSSTGITATAVNTTTVAELPGVLIEPDYDRSVDAGTTVTYAHTVTNTGNVTDTFTLMAGSSLGWLDSFTAGPLNLAPGASAAVYVTVTVPAGATPGMADTTMITATSVLNTAVANSAIDITRVRQEHGLAFSPDHTGSTYEGSQISYTHTLTNTGNGVDTFAITTSSSQGWAVTAAPLSLSLNPGEAQPVVVTLTVPTGTGGSVDVMEVTATSVISNAFSATAVNTTMSVISATRGVLLEPNNNSTGLPGDTIIYTHRLTNTGTVTDSYSLAAVSDQVWTAAVDPPNVALAAGASAPVTVTVTIPGGAANGQIDTTTVTAVSDTDPTVSDQAQDVTVVQLPANGVLLEPDRQGEGVPGEVIVYNHVLTNTGSVNMAFLLSVQSSQGWPVSVTPIRTASVPAGGTLAVTVVVTVPVTAVNGDEDFTTVTATGLTDFNVTDLALDRTRVAIRYGVLVTPDNSDTGLPGDVLTYDHIVQNTGNFIETFDLSVVSSLGWVTAVLPTTLTLDPDQSSSVQVTVTIPAGATTGAVDVTTVTAVSTSPGSTAADSATDTTTVLGGETSYLVYLPVVLKAQTCTTTGIDLIVTNIVVAPNPPVSGQPATVYVTIRNQGTANMVLGNNFFLDFYVDRLPAPLLVGDIQWGVQAVLLPAGASVIFSHPFTFSGGAHQLWAQVDTDNTVDECPYENNNVFGPMTMNATGFAAGDDGLSLPSDSGPRPTPTPPAAIIPPAPLKEE
jgi:uncharacterized membrane protein